MVGKRFQIDYLFALLSKGSQYFALAASCVTAEHDKFKGMRKGFGGELPVCFIAAVQLESLLARHFDEPAKIARPHASAPAMNNELGAEAQRAFNDVWQAGSHEAKAGLNGVKLSLLFIVRSHELAFVVVENGDIVCIWNMALAEFTLRPYVDDGQLFAELKEFVNGDSHDVQR